MYSLNTQIYKYIYIYIYAHIYIYIYIYITSYRSKLSFQGRAAWDDPRTAPRLPGHGAEGAQGLRAAAADLLFILGFEKGL